MSRTKPLAFFVLLTYAKIDAPHPSRATLIYKGTDGGILSNPMTCSLFPAATSVIRGSIPAKPRARKKKKRS